MMQIETFVVNPFSENTYLLYDETKEAVVIDCGCMNQKEFNRLQNFITEQGLILKHHLGTHIHADHLLGAARLEAAYDLLVETAREDVMALPPIAKQLQSFGLPPTKPFGIQTNLRGGSSEVHFGNTTLKVLAVPGHTPGSLAFYEPESKVVFVGDALFAGSIGRTDLWGGNQRQLIDAIHAEILTLPDETIVYPGHGPATTVKQEKSNNPYI